MKKAIDIYKEEFGFGDKDVYEVLEDVFDVLSNSMAWMGNIQKDMLDLKQLEKQAQELAGDSRDKKLAIEFSKEYKQLQKEYDQFLRAIKKFESWVETA